MQNRRIVSLILLGAMSCSLLTGCGETTDLSDVVPLTIDEVAGHRLAATSSQQDVESEIYSYVTDRIVVDNSSLIEVSKGDRSNIDNLLSNINTQLQGKGGANSPLSDEYANYLLLEFAKTPFEWTQSDRDIIGFDPAARLYFVDVTYSTTGTRKNVVPDSKIPNGHPEGLTLKQKRFMDYVGFLEAETNGDTEKAAQMRNTFINRWGSIQSIFDEQQGVSLYERTKQKANDAGGIGKLTYSGLVGDNRLAKGATMTIRYVFKYTLNLGEETDLAVDALYVKNYDLNDSDAILEGYKEADNASIEVLKPFIDQLILSYNKCVEESNHVGLYQLFSDYAGLDKYYDEIRDYTYNTIGGYSYKIMERKNSGNEVAVKVKRVYQVRARGAEISLPTYDETLIFNLLLGKDDRIYIKDIYLLNREMIGEPLSVIKNVTGISEQIQYSDVAFSEQNKKAVRDVLKKFSQVVVDGQTGTDAFLDCVDLGISQNVLNRMSNTIKAIQGEKKYTFEISWDTATNVYCSVRVREVFVCKNGDFDTEAVIDLGKRGDEWKVVNYTRILNVKAEHDTRLDTPEGQEKALCVNTRSEGITGELTNIKGETSRNDVEVTKPVTPSQKPSEDNRPINPSDIKDSMENLIPDNTIGGETDVNGEIGGVVPSEPPAPVPTPEPQPQPQPEPESSGGLDDFS